MKIRFDGILKAGTGDKKHVRSHMRNVGGKIVAVSEYDADKKPARDMFGQPVAQPSLFGETVGGQMSLFGSQATQAREMIKQETSGAKKPDDRNKTEKRIDEINARKEKEIADRMKETKEKRLQLVKEYADLVLEYDKADAEMYYTGDELAKKLDYASRLHAATINTMMNSLEGSDYSNENIKEMIETTKEHLANQKKEKEKLKEKTSKREQDEKKRVHMRRYVDAKVMLELDNVARSVAIGEYTPEQADKIFADIKGERREKIERNVNSTIDMYTPDEWAAAADEMEAKVKGNRQAVKEQDAQKKEAMLKRYVDAKIAEHTADIEYGVKTGDMTREYGNRMLERLKPGGQDYKDVEASAQTMREDAWMGPDDVQRYAEEAEAHNEMVARNRASKDIPVSKPAPDETQGEERLADETQNEAPAESDEIYSYTRAQAIDDGVLTDVSHVVSTMGFRLPTAIGQYAMGDIGDVASGLGDDLEAQRNAVIKIVMASAKAQIKKSPRGAESIDFQVDYPGFDGKTYTLMVHGGDQGEPVMTLMGDGDR